MGAAVIVPFLLTIDTVSNCTQIYTEALKDDFRSTGTLVLQPGKTLEIKFQAEGTLTYSGSYFNEVFVKINEGGHWGEDDEWMYSWPTGTIIVPQYDLQATTLNEVLRANAMLSQWGHWWRRR